MLLTLMVAAAAPQAPIDKGARAFYFAYGNCVVDGKPRRASEAVLSDVEDARLLKRYPVLLEGGCLNFTEGTWGYIKVQADKVRYAVADALVRAEFAGVASIDFSSVPPLDHGTPGTVPTQIGRNGKPLKKEAYDQALADYRWKYGASIWSKFGECVVRRDTATAHALLMSKPDSTSESALFSKLKPAFTECLPESQALELKKLPLRGTIAVNFYRLAKQAPGDVREAAE